MYYLAIQRNGNNYLEIDHGLLLDIYFYFVIRVSESKLNLSNANFMFDISIFVLFKVHDIFLLSIG